MAVLTPTRIGGVSARQFGVASAVAIAVATLGAATAAGGARVGSVDIPMVVLASALAAGVVATSVRTSPRVLPPGKDVAFLTAVTVIGFVGLYLAGWTNQQHEVEIARLLPLAVVALSFAWPEPNVLRYCLLLAAGTLLATVGQPVGSRVVVGAALVGLAVALVTTHRLTAASGPRLGGVAPARARRVAGEAATVFVVVGLLAALAASLLPPPPGQGGGGLGGDRRAPLPRPAAPPLEAGERLDVTAGRDAPGDGVVLLVTTSKPDVWRATTYDHWDGDSWSQSFSDIRPLARSVVAPGLGDIAGEEPTPRGPQSIIVLARSAGILPAAARPAYVSAEDAVVRQGADASLYPAPILTRGDRYFVASDLTQASGHVLRAVGDTPGSAVPPGVADAYLQLPEVATAVRALAARVTAGRSTTYDKVRAVESWIDDHTGVTTDARPVPPGTDPVEAFLFAARSGPAERAATSMVVMLRTLGVPARLATGFLPGTRTGPDRAFLVRSRDASAWVEVWFPTVGWQRFDPTGLAPDAHAAESVWDRLLRFLGRLWPLVVLVVMVAGGWLAWRVTRWWRRRAALPWATRFFARVERAGAARGRPRRPQETPVEYVNSLAAGVLEDPRLTEVGKLVTVAAWSRHEPAAEDRARAEEVLRAATRAAPVPWLRRRPRSRRAQGPTIAKP